MGCFSSREAQKQPIEVDPVVEPLEVNNKDMAICIVIFNVCETKRMMMNYFYTLNVLKSQGLPVFTLELVFGDRQPEIQDAIHVRSKSFMFHKERLYRILETKIPKSYTKLAFLDGDVLFSDPSWYTRASELLETHDVVQAFEQCHWLDLSYTQKSLTRKSILFMTEKEYSTNYHPGFAWCMERGWYNTNGFFDWAVSGSGDVLSTASWLKKPFSKYFKSCPPALKEEYGKYFQLPAPKITYLKDIEVLHLYHGTRENRQYVERHKMLEVNENIRNLIVLNSDGVFEWKEPEKWNPIFLTYFKNRNDDDTSSSFIDKKADIKKPTS
jgi:hypothetical protein